MEVERDISKSSWLPVVGLVSDINAEPCPAAGLVGIKSLISLLKKEAPRDRHWTTIHPQLFQTHTRIPVLHICQADPRPAMVSKDENRGERGRLRSSSVSVIIISAGRRRPASHLQHWMLSRDGLNELKRDQAQSRLSRASYMPDMHIFVLLLWLQAAGCSSPHLLLPMPLSPCSCSGGLAKAHRYRHRAL